MSLEVALPEDEEFRKELKEALKKPQKWYLERVDRAVRGRRGKETRKGRSLSVSRKR